MRIRALFNKKNYLKYISHLDLVRLFQRCFNMADIPVKFSQGFNPHPLHSIGNPLSLGFESDCEFLDVELEEDMNANEFKERMNRVLPKDIQILKAEEQKTKESINSIIDWSYYEIKFMIKDEKIDLPIVIEKWLDKDEIMVSILKKKGRQEIEKQRNIRPSIGNIIVKGKDENDFVIVEALLKSGDGGNLNPRTLIERLNIDLQEIILESLMVKRLNVFTEEANEIKSLL